MPPVLPQFQVTRLPNGLRVATAAMPHMTSVCLGIWVGAGSRYESAPLNGAAHFIEHLLFKGTKKRNALQISQAVEGLGGYLNAWTSEENTCFYSKARHDRFAELLDVLADMFLHSRFAPAEIAKEREVIREEVAMYTDDPQHYVHELLNAAQWPGQALGRPITGTSAGLARLGRSRLQAFMRANYVAPASIICAAGNIRHAQVLRAVRPYAAHWPVGPKPLHDAVRPRADGPVVRLHSRKTEQTQLALGIRTCSRHDERRFALRLLNVILGENASSRLFQRLREERPLTYSIQSAVSFFNDTGDLAVSAGLDDAKLAPALKIIVRELNNLCRTAPGRAELNRAKDYVLGAIDLGQENTETQMTFLAEHLLGFGQVVPVDAIKRGFARVTPAEIRAAAREFFHPTRLTLALISPLKRDPGLGKYLAQVGSKG